ncbi:MAG TPA: usg protein [Acetobacteraceae bacterium]|nr:usg protein [Acetobacteraceae bacterium]
MGLALQMRDYRLTTAEILYHMPDHPGVLQSYIWQELDLAPEFPSLRKFLEFWARELEGKVHSVRVASAELITPGRWQHNTAQYALN